MKRISEKSGKDTWDERKEITDGVYETLMEESY